LRRRRILYRLLVNCASIGDPAVGVVARVGEICEVEILMLPGVDAVDG